MIISWARSTVRSVAVAALGLTDTLAIYERSMKPELMFPALGGLLIVLAWPLATRRVRPNRWYGLRVPATFADPQVWYDANAVAGRDMMLLGAVALVITLGLPRVAHLPDSVYSGISAGILGLGSLLLTVRGWRHANRLLRQRRGGSKHQ